MLIKQVLIVWISILIITSGNDQTGGNSAGGAGTSERKTSAGKAIGTTNEAGQQEGVQKVNTGDLCEGNPQHADKTSGFTFLAACASCISKAGVDGQTCWLNTWTFSTHCECESYEFDKCHCYSSLNIMGTFCYVFLPVIMLAVIIIIQVCMRYTFCPMAKMEKELQAAEKKQAKKKKAGGTEGGSKKGSLDGMSFVLSCKIYLAPNCYVYIFMFFSPEATGGDLVEED